MPDAYFLTLCTCGARRGLHRHGDEACPNPLWRTGNGMAQWLTTTFTRLAYAA